MVIKFPNWYEHFQGSGYDLEREPQIFDGIYTGTESRDPVMTDQHLQPYESYEIIRYFENIAPGRNGGGWVDTLQHPRLRPLRRAGLGHRVRQGARVHTVRMVGDDPAFSGRRPRRVGKSADEFQFSEMHATAFSGANFWARVAGYSLEQADKFLGQLGNPIGIASYKPFHSTGEDFLHNYFGMIGIPIDLRPEFPTNANLVLLTECAKFDPDIVAKIKGQLRAGKSVVITSGLLRALQGKGIEDIVEVKYTDRKMLPKVSSAVSAPAPAPAWANKIPASCCRKLIF